MAKPNFGYQKRQKELEKKRKKEEKMKKRLEKHAAPRRGRPRPRAGGGEPFDASVRRFRPGAPRRSASPGTADRGHLPLRLESRHLELAGACRRTSARWRAAAMSTPLVVRTAPERSTPGSRAFFVRLGVPPKGIFGSGVHPTPPEARIHWRKEKVARASPPTTLKLRLEALFALPLITFDDLRCRRSGDSGGACARPAPTLPRDLADALEDAVGARVAASARQNVSRAG